MKRLALLSLGLCLFACGNSQEKPMRSKSVTKKTVSATPRRMVDIDSLKQNTDSWGELNTGNGLTLYIRQTPRTAKGPHRYLGVAAKGAVSGTSVYYFRDNLMHFSDIVHSPFLKETRLSQVLPWDIDADGQYEILMREYLHNGTLYEAVADRYFKVVDDLNIRYFYSIESLAWHPIYKVYIKRIEKKGIVSIYVSEKYDQPGELVGQYTLDFTKKNPVGNIRVFNKEYEGHLFTSSPTGKLREPDKE